MKPRLRTSHAALALALALTLSLVRSGQAGPAKGCTSDLPTCTVWGPFVAYHHPLCCQEGVASCTDLWADEYQCASGSKGHYQNVVWQKPIGGDTCFATGCGQ